MRIRFRPLWNVAVTHAFFGGVCDALEFVVPSSSTAVLNGLRAIARVRDGQLVVLIEVDDEENPLASPAQWVGRSLHFGLKPRSASFGNFTALPDLAAGQRPWWNNRLAAGALGGPQGLLLSGEQLRIEPVSAVRPVEIRVLTPDGGVRAEFQLEEGAEGRTLPGLWPAGEWRVEETVAGVTTARTFLVDPELSNSGCWGVLSLTIAAAHLAAGHDFELSFASRTERLRYYVVAERFSAAEFDEVEVHDGGFAADGRPEVTFDRLLPAAFGSDHLPPALLDAKGGARIALFQSQTEQARRFRGPTRIELQRNGEVLVGHLPAPGADRQDAQFVMHLSKP